MADGPAPSNAPPREYNAAVDLIGRNLAAGRADKTAFIDDRGAVRYGAFAALVDRAANALRGLGLEPEQRVLLCMLDTIDFPALFLGAIKAGIVPVPVNTLLTEADYAFMLRDSRARALIVSDALYDRIAPALPGQPHLRHVIVSGAMGASAGRLHLQTLLDAAEPTAAAAPTMRDDPCFWLYSSGSTGAPKGAVHLQSHLAATAEHYAQPVLGIEARRHRVLGGEAVLRLWSRQCADLPDGGGRDQRAAGRAADAPRRSRASLKERKPTIFFGVPTLYAAMLSSADLPARDETALRRCVSAGEALPEEIGRRWSDRFGVEILDGIGSTEMLHIFLSNRPGAVRYGTSGEPVPGYEIELLDEEGNAGRDRRDRRAARRRADQRRHVLEQRAKRSRGTFLGRWTRTGDKYVRDADGYYTYCGRADDMLKVGGIWVSPFEVETALMTHECVLEAAVVGHADEHRLVKPRAFVVLKPGSAPSEALAAELQAHVKSRLAPYKYPRWIEFVPELPKTATGKIQRFKLRDLEK